MRSRAAALISRFSLHRLHHFVKGRLGSGSQSDECDIVQRLAARVTPTFVEFGFHPREYNCRRLSTFSGLLIDCSPDIVERGKRSLPARLRVEQHYLTLENLGLVSAAFPEIGVLSIDVDGNDYWFLQALLPARPHVVCVEYNASLHLRPLTVPYDPAFDRHAKHPSGWYHGASLVALSRLCASHGYDLVAIASGGGNAFFARRPHSWTPLIAADAFRECALRNRWSGTTASQQWETIAHLPFTTV